MGGRQMDLDRQLDSRGRPFAESKDLGAGQTVTVIARWLLIVVGIGITLWSPLDSQLGTMKISIFVLLGLAVANFYLHAQLLMGKPIRPWLLYGASAVDL